MKETEMLLLLCFVNHKSVFKILLLPSMSIVICGLSQSLVCWALIWGEIWVTVTLISHPHKNLRYCCWIDQISSAYLGYAFIRRLLVTWFQYGIGLAKTGCHSFSSKWEHYCFNMIDTWERKCVRTMKTSEGENEAWQNKLELGSFCRVL